MAEVNDKDSVQVFSDEQIRHLESLFYICQIDKHLKAITNVQLVPVADNISPRVVLLLELLFDSQPVESISFDLHNYSYDDIIHLAKDIRSSEFVMREVDTILSGDIE